MLPSLPFLSRSPGSWKGGSTVTLCRWEGPLTVSPLTLEVGLLSTAISLSPCNFTMKTALAFSSDHRPPELQPLLTHQLLGWFTSLG